MNNSNEQELAIAFVLFGVDMYELHSCQNFKSNQWMIHGPGFRWHLQQGQCYGLEHGGVFTHWTGQKNRGHQLVAQKDWAPKIIRVCIWQVYDQATNLMKCQSISQRCVQCMGLDPDSPFVPAWEGMRLGSLIFIEGSILICLQIVGYTISGSYC